MRILINTLGSRARRLGIVGILASVVGAGAARGAAIGVVETTASYSINAPAYGDFKGDTDASGQIPATTKLTKATSSEGGASAGQYRASFGPNEIIANPTIVANSAAEAFRGALGARAQLVSDSDLRGVPDRAIVSRFFEAGATGTALWQDTATFSTTNPAGSSFELKFNLTTNLSVDVEYNPAFAASTWNASASANLSASGAFAVTLNAYDIKRGDNLPGGPSESERITSAYASQTVFIPAGSPSTVLLTGTLTAGVSIFNMDANLFADASHTALFAISTNDPLASYTTGSGFQFLTDVPEPATLALAASAGVVLARRVRRRVRRRA